MTLINEIKKMLEDEGIADVVPQEEPKVEKWDVISYDVLGNETDGYEVNDQHKVGTIEGDLTNMEFEAIVKLLQAEDYLNKEQPVSSYSEGQGDDTMIEIEWQGDNKPLLGLRKQME